MLDVTTCLLARRGTYIGSVGDVAGVRAVAAASGHFAVTVESCAGVGGVRSDVSEAADGCETADDDQNQNDRRSHTLTCIRWSERTGSW